MLRRRESGAVMLYMRMIKVKLVILVMVVIVYFSEWEIVILI